MEYRTLFKYGFRLVWWISNSWRFKKLGINSFIHNSLKITPSFIECGRGVYIYKNCRIEGVNYYNKRMFSPHIIIRDNVSIQQNLHLTCGKSIIIDKNTAIAANVTITDIHHPYEDIELPIERQDIITNTVYIGSDSKIYNNTVILPGTCIGRHVTIGANSVVSGNIPDYCVAVGSPAKIVKRYNFNSKSWEKTKPDGSFIGILT